MKLKRLFSEDLNEAQIQGWNKAFKRPRKSIADWFSRARDHLIRIKEGTSQISYFVDVHHTEVDPRVLLKKQFDHYMDQATPYEGSVQLRKLNHLITQPDLEFHADDQFSHSEGYVQFAIWPDRVECDVPLPESVKERLIKMVNDLKWSLYDVL